MQGRKELLTLDRVGGHQSHNQDFLLLPESMSSRDRLVNYGPISMSPAKGRISQLT